MKIRKHEVLTMLQLVSDALQKMELGVRNIRLCSATIYMCIANLKTSFLC